MKKFVLIAAAAVIAFSVAACKPAQPPKNDYTPSTSSNPNDK